MTRPAGQVRARARRSPQQRGRQPCGAQSSWTSSVPCTNGTGSRRRTSSFSAHGATSRTTRSARPRLPTSCSTTRPPAPTLQAWCRRYPHVSYGGWFRQWIGHESPEPYNSFGNGAAMRVSPAAFLNRDDLAAALAASDRVTEVTHDHPEGMKGARATVHAIWLALQRRTDPAAIRATITAEYGYDLTRTVDEIRPTYAFNEDLPADRPRVDHLRAGVGYVRGCDPQRNLARR